MGYYPDLNTITLDSFFNRIREVAVLSGQKILHEQPEARLACLLENGINNVQVLQTALKTKEKTQAVSARTGLSEDYLTVMRREINGYLPEALKLKDFPGLKADVVAKLKQQGIVNTLHLYEKIITAGDRDRLAEKMDIAREDVLELARLTDVCRLRWVGPAFARLLVAAGYDSVVKIAGADFHQLFSALTAANTDGRYYRGRYGENDIRLLVRVAQDVPQNIVW